MTNWVYKINGADLRQVVTNGSPFETIVQLQNELSKIITRFKHNKKCDELVYDFEQLFYLVEGEVNGGENEFIKYANSGDYGDGETQLTDDRLAEFYDLCNSWGIFITL